MHREKPHKLLQVGVTPTPATILRLEPKQRNGFKLRMSSIGWAKEGLSMNRVPCYGWQANLLGK